MALAAIGERPLRRAPGTRLCNLGRRRSMRFRSGGARRGVREILRLPESSATDALDLGRPRRLAHRAAPGRFRLRLRSVSEAPPVARSESERTLFTPRKRLR